ncbi:MAG: DUF4157 domain-containing protein [Halomonas sp. BM-2019]|nr:MAG: DUF4157 domain-containing protein [Halomonas sp. BM-2019]
MERSFSRDFSNVRVHTDKMAQDSASAIGARAYTSGSDIVFGSSEYDPGTSSGRWLLAHELTHVVQQSGRPSGPNLTVGPSGGSLEAEADNVANRIIRNTIPGSLMQDELQPDREAANLQASPTISQADVGNVIQMLPAPPSGSTYRYCGFGLDTNVPDFVKSHFNGTYNINYTTGCRWIALHAWSSLWELYDASDTRIDSNRRTPYGSYNITGSNIASGTPSDGSALWSLWYQVDRSQPWLTGDPDAYPHDYDTFHVYENPIRNPRTTLQEEVGPIVWQDNFTPAEDGAILQYNFSASATRSTTDSQTTTTSVTVGGQQSSNIGFEFEGLSGGFSRSLNFSATQSISRTHSVSVSETQSLSRNFTQPNLQGGVTYSVKMRPLYHLVDGSVDQISHRNGVVTGTGATLTGAIRVLKGMDLAITSSARSGGPGSDAPGSGTQARPWHCTASCNVEGTEPQCQNKRATGRGSGPNQNEACKAAKRDANNSVPSGCYKRHCQCDCSQ